MPNCFCLEQAAKALGVFDLRHLTLYAYMRATPVRAEVKAPLDHVSARGRAKVLFGFDYVWEVYKPEHKR